MTLPGLYVLRLGARALYIKRLDVLPETPMERSGELARHRVGRWMWWVV